MQELLLQYRIVPIFQAHHSCSLSLQDLHQACIPSPCRDNDHLGILRLKKKKKKVLWHKPSTFFISF
uniref:Uncharacterized protein n=1 Tax=Colobus angolensis palliatus TaxID=336983 RepID=A0A2K5HSX7_COLAP